MEKNWFCYIFSIDFHFGVADGICTKKSGGDGDLSDVPRASNGANIEFLYLMYF